MDTIYILFLFMIGIIIAVGVGIELSNGIEEFIIYVLFWMLYIITIITFVNIVLVGNYYITMKDKTGPIGPQGKQGESGNKGEAGLCDSKCRDSICENNLTDLVLNNLKEKNQGSAFKLNNIYIKSKIRQMCQSDEFKQLAPYNGQLNLINYLKTVWTIWIDAIYESGGLKYFENIGSETEFDWVSQNPFDELKQYDVFYWGMGKQYRPQIIDKCYDSADGNTVAKSSYIFRASKTNYYEYLGNDNGSGSINNVSFWRAQKFTYKENVYYPVGDIAIGPVTTNDNMKQRRTVGVYEINGNKPGPMRETIIVSGDVKGPIDYELIWTNKTTSSTTNNLFWIWRPIPPDSFIALGDIVTFSQEKPNTGENAPIRCVPKDITILMQYNGNIFWSSVGTKTQTNVSLLGFVPNDGSYAAADTDNVYNLFRALIGNTSNNPNNNLGKIPDTDINANFYILDINKYDSTSIIGLDVGKYSNPDLSSSANKVGKGYIPTTKKDAKYSVMAYLKLKNNAILTHVLTKITLNCNLIPNAISNAYLIKYKNKCLNYDVKLNKISLGECDELIDTQLFSIIFTGDKKNECRLQNYNTKKFIKYKSKIFTLIDENDNTNREYTLFIMS